MILGAMHHYRIQRPPLLLAPAKRLERPFFGLRLEIEANSEASRNIKQYLLLQGREPDLLFDPNDDTRDECRCLYIYASDEWHSQCRQAIINSQNKMKESPLVKLLDTAQCYESPSEDLVFKAWDTKTCRVTNRANAKTNSGEKRKRQFFNSSSTSFSSQQQVPRRSKRIRTRSGRLTRSGPAKVLFRFPYPPERSRVEVTDLDKERIDDDFLNDSLIDYFLRRLQNGMRNSTVTTQNSFFLFNTFSTLATFKDSKTSSQRRGQKQQQAENIRLPKYLSLGGSVKPM